MKKSKQFIFPELRPPDKDDMEIKNIGKQEVVGHVSLQTPKPKQREIKPDEFLTKKKIT